jgi:hypothetical protein
MYKTVNGIGSTKILILYPSLILLAFRAGIFKESMGARN